MGLPVIATNFSGVTAYLDDSVGYPLPFKMQPVPSSEPDWFRGEWPRGETCLKRRSSLMSMP